MAKTLYILDGHGLIYAAFFAPMRQSLTSPSGEHTKATYIFTTALVGLLERQKPDMLAVAMDSKVPTFRSGLYPEYKAHRPPMPEDLPGQIARIEQILKALRIPVLKVDGFEADDVIGTVARRAAEQGFECSICSGDKDVLQLLGDRVRVYDVKTGAVTTAESLAQAKGITPQQFIDCLALQGDASDNVPGVPDVGPKTAVDWIQRYGSLENLYQHADEITGKRGESLRTSRAIADLSRRLVTIDCSVPLEIDWRQLEVQPFDKEQLARLFGELGFERLLDRLCLQRPGRSPDPDASAGEPAAAGSQDQTWPAAATGQTLQGGTAEPCEPASLGTVEHRYHLIDTEQKLVEFAARIKAVPQFAVDTETTSIDAMAAELVAMSFCWQPHEAFYLPLKGPLGAKCLPLAQVRRLLGPILADAGVRKIGQNIKYDLLVLHNAGLGVEGVAFDTMVASYCLDPLRFSHSMDNLALDWLNYRCIPITELIGTGRNQRTFDLVDTSIACEYAAEDADITLQLYLALGARLDLEPQLKKLFEEVEMPLVTVLAAMELAGVAVDMSYLRTLGGQIDQAINQVADQINRLAGSALNVNSTKQLAGVLFDRLGLPPSRAGKTGRSTDAAVLEGLVGKHPIIPPILEYRQLSKLKNTYVDKLITLVHHRTGRVHTSFNQTVTATGRLSSSDPNLQNIPVRTDLGKKIRSAFVAQAAGDCLLSADYSQIELRLLAHFSQDQTLLAAFAADQDIHRFVASQIYGVPIDEVTNEMRSRCKAVNFGIIYGQGPYGLSQTTGLSVSEAKRFIEEYFARYRSIRAFMDEVLAGARKAGYVETLLHRRRQITDLDSREPSKRSQAARFAVNTVIQGSAADLIKLAMIHIHRLIRTQAQTVRMILQVHDELVFELPEAEVEEHGRWIAHEMTTAMDLAVPLKVDLHHGKTWLE
jgi:DNA polymerase I